MLVGVMLPDSQVDPRDPLGELAALARTAGARVVDRMLQRRQQIDPSYFIGKGKVEELRERVGRHAADVIIFNDDLSPAQLRDIEEATGCKVVDRSELILDIFATRAKTHQARLQVELAQLEYTAPRLRGMWSHLERIAGAGGATGAGVVGGIGTRGPGERQIEIDRRIVRRRVTALRRELGAIDRRRLREVRSRAEQLTICLVGYTNAGKSTLMRALTGAETLIEDKLFATLDTKTRKWDLGAGQVALLSDTVGFVHDLPHHLVASFRATLEEVIHARLLVHVVDVSSPMVDLQMASVNRVLEELGCADKPTLVALNKIDLALDRSIVQIAERRAAEAIHVSARTGEGLEQVTEWARRKLRDTRVCLTLRAKQGDGRLLSYLDRHGEVVGRRYDGDVVELDVRISPAELGRLGDNGEAFEIVSQEPASPVPAGDGG